MYILKSKYEKNSGRKAFLYDDTYISNGHFLIRQNLVRDCYRWMKPMEQVESWKFESIIDSLQNVDLVAFEKTEYLYDTKSNGYARIFTDVHGNNTAIQEDYVKSFNVVTLYGNSPKNALKTHDEIIIMPMTLPEFFQNKEEVERVA